MSQYMELLKFEDNIISCMRCGFCMVKCPIYENYGWISNSPRGRVQIARGLLENRLVITEYMIKSIMLCTTCEYCSIKCPSNVHTINVIGALKYEIFKSGNALRSHLNILDNIKKNGNPYGEPKENRGLWIME